MRPSRLTRFCANERGTAAVEFAIVGPIFLTLTVGMIYVCMLMFTVGSMQYAVEEGARCYSVKTTVCTDNASAATYARNAYYGPITTPNFTASVVACGHRVNASTDFTFNSGLGTFAVPITATSCFP
jgi:Flp pilus assembly protein TadG